MRRLALLVIVALNVTHRSAEACPPERGCEEAESCVARGSILELEPNADPLDVCIRFVDRDGRPAGLAERPRIVLREIRAGVHAETTIMTTLRDDSLRPTTFCPIERLAPGATYQVWLEGDHCVSDPSAVATFTTPETPPARPQPPSTEPGHWPWRLACVSALGALFGLHHHRRRRLRTFVP